MAANMKGNRPMKRTRIFAAGVVAALLMAGCDLDLNDPNQPTETEVIGGQATLMQVAIGLQAEYSDALVNPVYTVGIITDELGAIPEAFESFRNADAGLPILYNEGPALNTWSSMYRVVRVADVIINQAPQLGFSPGMGSGMLALAKFYKGLALGQIYQLYPAAPIAVGPNIPHPQFVDRQQVVGEALRLLEEARGHLQSTPPPAQFGAEVLAPGFNLPNSIDAMIARFSLMAGRYDEALAAAQRVNLNVFSEFRFSAADPNPLWNMWYNSGNAFQLRARRDFTTQAQPGDQRVGYWITPLGRTGATQLLDGTRRFEEQAASFPVYLPDEMRLIMAEVFARRGDTAQALQHVNAVRIPCTSPLPEPVACLPALTGGDVPTPTALLGAILRERRYELFLQGVRLSDLRRFDVSRKYDFMPIPITECDRNPNAPRELCPG
jgi:starch-binding outer membrane protein, SusD/RagB family